MGEENELLSQAIREVAQLVVDDSERGPEEEDKVTVLVKSTSLARSAPHKLPGHISHRQLPHKISHRTGIVPGSKSMKVPTGHSQATCSPVISQSSRLPDPREEDGCEKFVS